LKYSLTGLKKELKLAANETKMIEVDAKGRAILDLWVDDVAKGSIEATIENTSSAELKADLVTVKPLSANAIGKLRFECENHGSQPMTVRYALAGSDLKKDFVLAANETKVIELNSTGNGSLDLWVNDIAKPSVAGITVSSTADLVIVRPLPVLEVGKIRFQYENHASEPVTVKYALAGSNLRKEVVLAANETQIIEIPSTGNASLELWVNEVAKTPVEANTDISILNPNVNPESDTNPDTSSGTSPDTGSTSGDTNSGTPQNTGTLPDNQTPNSQNAANGANGAQPGSGVLVGDTSTNNSNPSYVAGVSDESVAGYDQLPQTGEKFPWNYYLIGTLMVLFGVMSLLKFRRNQ
jgi:LPXTG-motif cell wall-anchored protein